MIHIFLRELIYWGTPQKLWSFFIFWILVVSVAQSGDDPENAPNSASRFRIDSNGPIIIPVEVFGDKGSFVIDTGASQSVLDSVFRVRLGAIVGSGPVTGHSGVAQIDFFTAPEIAVLSRPPIAFRSLKHVACADFSAINTSSVTVFNGVLGMDFLASRVVRLNFDQGFGEFRDDVTFNSADSLRLNYRNAVPCTLLKLPLEGFTSFLLDTGSGGCSICLDRGIFTKLLGKRRIKPVREVTASTNSSTVKKRFGILEFVELGQHRFHNVTVCDGPVNSINMPLLRRFNIEFDFPKQVARFQPSERVDIPDPYNRAGLGVECVDNAIVASVTDPHDVAGRAGIQNGDLIRKINGTVMKKTQLLKVIDLLREPGADVRIEFERDGVIKQVTLALSNEPDPFPAISPHEMIKEPEDFDELQ